MGIARQIGLLGLTLLLSLSSAALAQNDTSDPTIEEVMTAVEAAVETITAYSLAQREQAEQEAQTILETLDGAVSERNQMARERWAEFEDSLKVELNALLTELNSLRGRLHEMLGAMKAGAESAWEELKLGFLNALDELAAAIEESEELMKEAE